MLSSLLVCFLVTSYLGSSLHSPHPPASFVTLHLLQICCRTPSAGMIVKAGGFSNLCSPDCFPLHFYPSSFLLFHLNMIPNSTHLSLQRDWYVEMLSMQHLNKWEEERMNEWMNELSDLQESGVLLRDQWGWEDLCPPWRHSPLLFYILLFAHTYNPHPLICNLFTSPMCSVAV